MNEGGRVAGEVEKGSGRGRGLGAAVGFLNTLLRSSRACWDEKKWVVLWEKRGCGKCSDVLVG